jgi:hypothetical protein
MVRIQIIFFAVLFICGQSILATQEPENTMPPNAVPKELPANDMGDDKSIPVVQENSSGSKASQFHDFFINQGNFIT